METLVKRLMPAAPKTTTLKLPAHFAQTLTKKASKQVSAGTSGKAGMGGNSQSAAGSRKCK